MNRELSRQRKSMFKMCKEYSLSKAAGKDINEKCKAMLDGNNKLKNGVWMDNRARFCLVSDSEFCFDDMSTKRTEMSDVYEFYVGSCIAYNKTFLGEL